MNLLAFRVTDFRSVQDSGWISVEDLTALIGTNESGKTNLLLPLWKLNPAGSGDINPLIDMPRHRYHELRKRAKETTFIRARFELPYEQKQKVAKMTSFPENSLSIVEVERRYDGSYYVDFPKVNLTKSIEVGEVCEILERSERELKELEAQHKHEPLKRRMIAALSDERQRLLSSDNKQLDVRALQKIIDRVGRVKTGNAPQSSITVPRYKAAINELRIVAQRLQKPHPRENQEAQALVEKALPAFVYYSNYGNLDSEIYLPHVLQNMRRDDLGEKEKAKARTLKVLFEYVGLNPQEILDLGRDFEDQYAQRNTQAPKPTETQIKEIADKKKEREVLLRSASVDLTRKFRDWWKQGEYQFRFQADGDHFRIWVSDDRRPEEVELEGRSAGLQWFLSFYLIFLVESKDAHSGAFLLLDEPGLSLHPVAQQDLSRFFDSLSGVNQLIYTTHSPFMVDPDHLDRVRSVFVNDQGKTAVSEDLRASETNKDQSNSVYLVNTALGISASEGLLYGGQAVIVEGPSDQISLSAMKNYLIANGLINPSRELVFVPAGGTRGVKSVAGIFTGRDGIPPPVVLDADQHGKALAANLRSGNIYAEHSDRIIVLDTIVDGEKVEIEDLWPFKLISDVVSRYFRGPDEFFDDFAVPGKPISTQIDDYISKYELEPELGYKVEIAKQLKRRLLKDSGVVKETDDKVQAWVKLFGLLA